MCVCLRSEPTRRKGERTVIKKIKSEVWMRSRSKNGDPFFELPEFVQTLALPRLLILCSCNSNDGLFSLKLLSFLTTEKTKVRENSSPLFNQYQPNKSLYPGLLMGFCRYGSFADLAKTTLLLVRLLLLLHL